MTYISNQEIESLPVDPEQRLIEIERIVRDRLKNAKNCLSGIEDLVDLQRSYLSMALPSANHYGITAPNGSKRLRANHRQSFDTSLERVDCAIAELRLQNIDRAQAHSVALDVESRIKLRRLLDQINETIDQLDISARKKEVLRDRTRSLFHELDRHRTRWEAFGALMIESCDDADEASIELEPLVRLVERVGAALGNAKRLENSRSELSRASSLKRVDPAELERELTEFDPDEMGIPF
jgi:hypothetical protein